MITIEIPVWMFWVLAGGFAVSIGLSILSIKVQREHNQLIRNQ